MGIAGVKVKETPVTICEKSIDRHLQSSIQTGLRSKINNGNNPLSCNLHLDPLTSTIDAIFNTTTFVSYHLYSRASRQSTKTKAQYPRLNVPCLQYQRVDLSNEASGIILVQIK